MASLHVALLKIVTASRQNRRSVTESVTASQQNGFCVTPNSRRTKQKLLFVSKRFRAEIFERVRCGKKPRWRIAQVGKNEEEKRGGGEEVERERERGREGEVLV
jgi:hypothetical protein